MVRFFNIFQVLLITIVQANASPLPKADSGYGAPSYEYGAPRVRSYRPRYKKQQTHTHHHYYHHGAPKPTYHAPKPSYNPPVYADYGPPARRPLRYAPSYGMPIIFSIYYHS